MAASFDKVDGIRFKLRTFSGIIGNYSLALFDSLEDSYTYHILAVILPENLYYQRLHILLTGAIDLSYVVFLVNEELEKDTFPIRGLRTFYMGRLKNILESTTGRIHLVPKEVISKGCFLQEFTLPRNITERKLTVASIGEMFKQFVATERMDLSLLYKAPELVKPVGPLVPAVKDTDLVHARFAQLAPQQLQERTVRMELVDQEPTAILDLETIRSGMLAPANGMEEGEITARVEQGVTIVDTISSEY